MPIPIIYYHSIGPILSEWYRNYLTLEPRFFEDQLRYFRRHFQVIDLYDYYRIRSGVQAGPANPLVITLDDGYLDNWVWAYPLLKKYGLRATIFVNPEFVDPRSIVRPNLEAVWRGELKEAALSRGGYLSWEELRLMQESSLVDIQSHTMTHTKYIVSDRITDFHHPAADALYPIGNLHPEQKPFYIGSKAFEQLLPYGTPFFEQASSVIARRVDIHPDFAPACANALKGYDFNQYRFETALAQIRPIYEFYQQNETLIVSRESESGYRQRLEHEIAGSKKRLEQKLGKPVDFLCWPHGDNDATAHEAALDAGYLATTTGSRQKLPDRLDRIPIRLGLHHSRNNLWLTRWKTRYKMGAYLNKFPFWHLQQVYYKWKGYEQ